MSRQDILMQRVVLETESQHCVSYGLARYVG
jgi:hypothetical protein